jgi:hypothetical protein
MYGWQLPIGAHMCTITSHILLSDTFPNGVIWMFESYYILEFTLTALLIFLISKLLCFTNSNDKKGYYLQQLSTKYFIPIHSYFKVIEQTELVFASL